MPDIVTVPLAISVVNTSVILVVIPLPMQTPRANPADVAAQVFPAAIGNTTFKRELLTILKLVEKEIVNVVSA